MSTASRRRPSLGVLLLSAAALTAGPVAADLPPQPADASPAATTSTVTPAVPAWAADAAWYQVFVPRFANGDPANDPPNTWPWTADWCRQPPDNPPDRVELYFRRYGGDLAGLRSKLDYLQALGVNTLYLNPVFAAPSEDKYDTADYRHIDDTLGQAGARKALTGETADPATWRWSASDRLFLDLLADAHRRGLRVVIDGVFNHAGRDFWAFADVRRHGEASPYADWFEITDFGPPLAWQAWDGPNGRLVRFARTDQGLHPEVEAHLLAITRRWLDPDGDGDPSDGVDGWRLDAAEQLPAGFWRRWRQVVKAVNPDALILGEIWSDPTPWLQGDQFDVTTNYGLARAVVRFCRPGAAGRTATDLAATLDQLAHQFDPARTNALVNLLGSHDTDRLLSMMANPRDAYDRDNHPGEGTPAYDGDRPADPEAYARLRLAAVLQFTVPGAPMIYYGDEVGMPGGDDPYARAPMWWPDQPGIASAGYRAGLYAYYRELLNLRRRLAPLRRGRFDVLLADDSRRVLAFARTWRDQRVVVLVNGSTRSANVHVTLGRDGQTVTVLAPELWSEPGAPAPPSTGRLGPGGALSITLPPLGARVLLQGVAVPLQPGQSAARIGP